MSTKLNTAAVETARQEIIRLRGLLDKTRLQLAEGEVIYAQLFDALTPEEMALSEAERQQIAAQHSLADAGTIKRAVTHMQYYARDLERACAELYHTITNNR